MTAKEHYANHLGDFYSWMSGDFEKNQYEQQKFFIDQKICPSISGIAIDLGAGNGLQSISLAKLGFTVKAIDFNKQLLAELKANSNHLQIELFENDIRLFKNYSFPNPELIVCAGDTITHLASRDEIKQLIEDCSDTLCNKGKLILTFRDYSNVLEGNDRFIPVKGDESKILTCCLDYYDSEVRVTDLLYTKTDAGWEQSVSSYYKVRVSQRDILTMIEDCGLKILLNEPINRLITIIAQK